MNSLQITIRNVDPLLKSKIKQNARLRSMSMNEWALMQMRKGVGLTDTTTSTHVEPSWKKFVGKFPETVIASIDAVEDYDVIDESAWKQ